MCEVSHLLSVCAHLNGIRNETRCFLFRHGADVFQPHCELHTCTQRQQNTARFLMSQSSTDIAKHHRDGFDSQWKHKITYCISFWKRSNINTTKQDLSNKTYQRLPAKDVAVKTDPVFGEVETALQENVPLKSARVVCQWEDKVKGQKTLFTIHQSLGYNPYRSRQTIPSLRKTSNTVDFPICRYTQQRSRVSLHWHNRTVRYS